MIIPLNISIPILPIWTSTNPIVETSDVTMPVLKNASAPTSEQVTHNDFSNKKPESITKSITSSINITPQNHKTATGLKLLSILWIVGSLVFLLYHFSSYLFFYYHIKRWKHPLQDCDIIQQVEYLSKQLHIKRKIPVYLCTTVSSPMLVGIWNPTILLPKEDYSPSQLKIILTHELIHYKHHDIPYKFLLLLTNSIHWFNPLVYHMLKVAHHNIEVACDESVIKNKDYHYREIYSYTILETITQKSSLSPIALSTYFQGDKKRLKNRFAHIMNIGPKKKGAALLCILLCLSLMIGTFVSFVNEKTPRKTLAKTLVNATKKTLSTKNTALNHKSNILFAGLDTHDSSSQMRSDAMILVTIDPNTQSLTFTSFLRDTYVGIPGYGNKKLSAAYSLGGIKLLKETIEQNFDITIDGTVATYYEGFEKMIDQLDGVKLSITQEEASYLNKTNFISKAQNRNLKSGVQVLNGNQATGYMRLRQVPTSENQSDDIGRTARARNLLFSCFEKCKSSDLSTLVSIIKPLLPYVITDLDKKLLLSCVETIFTSEYTCKSMQIPAEGTYDVKKIDNTMAIVTDFETNKELLDKMNK